MEDWEVSKENYQPLKAGRKPDTLRAFGTVAQDASIEEQRSVFVREIESYKGDDPLELWLRYIKWTQETFKTGGHKAELLPLLERCTRELQAMERYKTDIRYLRVWIQYADCLPEPGDVFAFLKENEVGQEHALFYIAFATYLELRGNYTAADNVYQQGINRLADPVDRIRAKFDEFQHRMARRIQRKAEQASLGEDTDHPERHTLGILGGRKGPRTQGLGGSKRKAVATPGKEKNTGGGGLEIFVDDEFTTGAGSSGLIPGLGLARPSSAASGDGQSSWSQLPSFQQTRKENVQQASTWTGQRIKQKPALSVPAAPPLEIPIDPELEDAEAEAKARAASVPHISLRQRLEQDAGDESLFSDPLRHHRAPLPVHQHVAPAPSASNMTNTTALRPKRTEVLVVDVSKLADDKGNELSFEELRASKWQAKNKLPVLTRPQSGPSASPFDEAADFQQPQISTAAEEALQAIQANFEGASTSDITMSTRDAFAAVNAMFSNRMGGSSGMEPTMTLNTKDAFAAINGMFKGSFNHGSSDVTMNFEPTMSFKNACDAMNQLFAGSGANLADAASESQAMPQASGLFVRTDTMLQSTGTTSGPADPNPAVDSPAPAGLFDIREDTIFISNRGAPSTVAPSPADDEGLMIREDTVFINPKSTANMFDIREDTVFINAPGAVVGESSLAGGLDIREDTIFIKNMDLPTDSKAPETAGKDVTQPLHVPETEVIVRVGSRYAVDEQQNSGTSPTEELRLENQENKWGFVPGADETIVIARHGVNAVMDRAPQGSTGLSAELRGLDLEVLEDTGESGDVEMEDKENAHGTSTTHRKLNDPSVAATVLQPMMDGVEIEENPEAEAALQAVPLAEDGALLHDEFEVFSDDGPIDASKTSHTRLVNPFKPAFQAKMLQGLEPPVAEWPNVVALTSEEEQAAAVNLKRAKKAVTALGTSSPVNLGGAELLVGRCIGSGAYATVYQASVVASAVPSMAAGSDVALKYETPPCPWEWYICRVLHGRLSEEQRTMFSDPTALLLGDAASILVMPRGKVGTLQDLVNTYRKQGQTAEECVVMHCSVQLLRVLQSLHNAEVLHTDIKPDNFLVGLDVGHGTGTSTLNVQLIDFGRCVDLQLLPSGTKFQGDCDTDSFRCVEMREGTPWLWQADSYSIAGVIHCLLFGEYMDVERVKDTEGVHFLRIKAGLRRYWDGELWREVFDVLLNSANGSTPPQLTDIIEKLEHRLAGSQTKLEEEIRKLSGMLTRGR